MNAAIRYSEAFKQQVVDEISKGKFSSAYRAQMAYGIKGNETGTKWIRKYGRDRFFKALDERGLLLDSLPRPREQQTAANTFNY